MQNVAGAPGVMTIRRHPPIKSRTVPGRRGRRGQPDSQFTGMGNTSEDQGKQADHYQQADQEDYTNSSADELEHWSRPLELALRICSGFNGRIGTPVPRTGGVKPPALFRPRLGLQSGVAPSGRRQANEDPASRGAPHATDAHARA
ncbi:hypothetical protein [Geminicoccus harenae]|uniref:hypothetical protein n=1 Tax=Geminicoccus harenae TaxID=2498453 RepID=UPI00168C02DB|nr:hypothetical protein [Geminicoccus harenae]